MDFKLSEEQNQIKALIKDFAKRELNLKELGEITDRAIQAKSVEELRSFQRPDLLEKLHDVGLRQLCVPTEYGGGGVTYGGYVTRAIAAEEAGYSMGPAARLLNIPWMICAAHATCPYVDKKQRDWLFDQFMENHHLFLAGTISEPQGATDIHRPYDGPDGQLNVAARKEGKEWVINGNKMFSSGAGVAELFEVGCRTAKNAPISDAMTWFWIRKDTPGVSQIPNRLLGGELTGNVQTFYDNVRVPDSHRIGEVNKGFDVLMNTIAVKMLHFSAMCGGARKLLELVAEYAKERLQGGKPIIMHSSIAHMLGDATIQLEAARAFMYKASWENDQLQLAGQPMNLFWSLSTYYNSKKMAARLGEVAYEIYGGIGGSIDMPLNRYLRNLWVFMPGGSTPSMNAIESCWHYHNVDYKAPERAAWKNS